MGYAFIRHGQTEWNREGKLQGSSDVPLNDTGRTQALAAARILADDGPWDAIVSSPLSRARETAEIIARELGIDLGPAYAGFRERDYGPLEGTSEAAARADHPAGDYPGAETHASVAARGRAALDEVARDYGDAAVVIVCHGTMIRYTLESVAGRPIDRIVNGSISRFAHDADANAWNVLSVNGIRLEPVAEA